MSELEWIEIFGDNLVGLLEDARMTQRDLADETGLAESTISRYINKQSAPSIFAVINIAYALDCDFNDLIDFGSKIN